MKYANASDVLPDALIHELQKYIHGSYLYIPSPEPRSIHVTAYQWEIDHRNRKINRLHLEGIGSAGT